MVSELKYRGDQCNKKKNIGVIKLKSKILDEAIIKLLVFYQLAFGASGWSLVFVTQSFGLSHVGGKNKYRENFAPYMSRNQLELLGNQYDF